MTAIGMCVNHLFHFARFFAVSYRTMSLRVAVAVGVEAVTK